MAFSSAPIYLSTLLLEKNRWNGKGPSLLVSDWAEPIGEAGFAGLEIWINHLFLASRSEWDLIKERALESDLTLAYITAAVPSDMSDKSRRLRDAVIEACDYFRPDGFKFTIAEDTRKKGTASAGELLESIRVWTGDIHRDVSLLYSGREGESGLDGLLASRQVLKGGRFKAALNPFFLSPSELETALKTAGDFIGNLGVQARKDDAVILLEENKSEHARIIAMTRKQGFKGTWSLEMTKGVGGPKEDVENMFDNAEKDFNFLTEALVRTAQEKI